MLTFALVTEGVTDQAVLERILEGLFGAAKISTNPLQPLRDATDASRLPPQAGWERVLEFCESENIADALAFNDYVIVQIDTDQGDHLNFGVPLTIGGADQSIDDIIELTIAKIEASLGDEICKKFYDRFVFAIAVHSTECWLCAHFDQAARKERTKNCNAHLIKLLTRQDIYIEKTYKSYFNVSRPLSDKKLLLRAASKCKSLRYFVYALHMTS